MLMNDWLWCRFMCAPNGFHPTAKDRYYFEQITYVKILMTYIEQFVIIMNHKEQMSLILFFIFKYKIKAQCLKDLDKTNY